MADNKKNQDALEALHKLQDARASTANATKVDWSSATDTDSFIKTATETTDSVIRSYTKNVDSDYINSFIKDSGIYLKGILGANTRMGVGTSQGVYKERKAAADDLFKRSYEISRYLEEHKDEVDSETYEALKGYLDAFDQASSQSIYSFYKNNQFYSQFSSKEEYDDYVKKKEEYEALVNFDINAAEKEIADLEAQRDDFYWNHDYDATNHRERVAFDEALKERDSQIAEKKKYLKQVQRFQEGLKLSSVADPFSGSYDRNFQDLSQYSSTVAESTSWWQGRTEDTQYEWINNQNGFRDAYEQDIDALNEVAAATSQSSFFIAPTESVYRKQGYDQLTKDEIAIYNYYYAKDGKEKAQEYLDNLQETLNYRKATAMYGELEDQTALELAFGVQAGLDQFSSGMRNLFNTEDDYIPQTAVQMTSGMVREDLADAGKKLPDWMGGASLGQVGYDAITTTANMAPSILTSMAVGMLNPVAGQLAGQALMGMSAAGNAYQEALNEGYDKNQARGYGLLVGASEIVMEKVLGGISALGGNALGKTLTSNLGSADTALKMIAKKLGGSMLSEFGEEYLQEVLTPVFQNLMLGTDNEVKLFSADALYAGILGALTAGIMEGPTAIAGEVQVKNTGKQLQKADISAQRLADLGKTFSADTVAFKLAGKVTENTGAYTMGRLFNEIGATLTEQNKTDITNALRAEGMSTEIAKRHAQIMSDIIEGGELSDVQMKMIEKNDVLSKVMKEVLIDENSTVNQRTRGYNDALMSLAREKAGAEPSRTEQAAPGQESQEMPDKVIAENKQASQSEYEASTDGKTILKSTGETVDIQEVATIKDGQMTLKTTDGRTVDAKDVSYASESEALVYEAVANMGATPKAANILVEGFKAVQADGMSASVYAHGIDEAFRYGKLGIPVSELKKTSFASKLNPGQQEYVYRQGRKVAGKLVAKEQATVSKKESVATTEKTSQVDNKVGKASAGVFYEGTDGAVTDWDSHVKDSGLVTEAKRASAIQAMKTLSKALGIKFYVFESYLNSEGKRVFKDRTGKERSINGYYDPKDGSIHIDLHAGKDGNGTMLFTMAHELTHFIKQWSPAKFKKLANFLVQEYSKVKNVDELVHAKMEKTGLDYDDAFEEVVADAMESMLADGKVMEKLAKLKEQDRSLWQKIKDFVDNWAAKLKAAYEGLAPDSTEGKDVAEMVDAIEHLQELFAEGLVDASENYQAAEQMGIEVDADTESVSPALVFSERTWTESDYVQERTKAAKEIAKAIGVSEKKAKAYIDDVNSIAKMIAEDRVRLDYFSSPGRSSFVGNVEYGGSFDFSTLCKKRRLLTGTFTAIQKALPNTALTADEILDIRNRMKKADLEVSCGLCYVEGSRANMGQFAKEFLKLYKQYYPDAWQPNMADVNTPDGIEWVRINHPECYEQYEYFWNHYGTMKPGDKNLFASQQKPKLYQLHTEYKGEILQKFKDDDNVEEKNLNGGIRLQSFSDFEIVHLIDTMQIIMDMSRVGLAGQAYTKVPDFAWALGDTGLKINLSLIAKGVDENGKLIFDDVEGMPIADAMRLRDRYSANVGTILVAFNDEQLLAAMADDRVDYIIPFHRSQWKKSQYAAMGLPAKTKDYTYMQNEKFIKPQYHEYRGRMVKDKATNYMPNEYWDFSKSGKENAESYLQMCARNNKRPKFYKLLQNNGDGSYSLKADGSTDGYWKLLIDFKMYDNDGNGSPQMPVKPAFNMDEATRMLDTYSGGHSNFPVAQGIVDDFVKEYKESHKGVKFSSRDYAYDSLVSKPDMTVTTVGGNVPKNRADVIAQAKKNAAKVGKFNPKDGSVSVHVKDINRDVILGTAGLKHSLDRRMDVNASITLMAGEILQNSIKINELTPQKAEADESYVLIGAARNSDGELHVVRSVVNRFSNELASMDVLYAINAKKENRLRSMRPGFQGPVTDSTISIADLLDHVNQYFPEVLPEDVLKHYGHDARPDGKLGESALYSYRDTESVSNRSLLANALESAAKNEKEKQKIREYKEKITLINAEEENLRALNRQLRIERDPDNIKVLRFEANQAANRINTYDRQLLNLEASQPLKDVLTREKKMAFDRGVQRGRDALEAYRERAEKKHQETIERYQESRKRGAENRQKAAMRQKIRKTIRDLDKILNRGDKKRNVKEDLKDFVADALFSAEILFTDNYSNEDMVRNGVGTDMTPEEAKHMNEARKIMEELANLPAGYDGWLARQDQEFKLKGKLDYRMGKLRDVFIRERARLNKTQVSEVLGNLADSYARLETSEYSHVQGAYHENVYEYLKMLQEDVGGTIIKDMTLGQLEETYKAYTMVMTTVHNANRMFAENLKNTRDALANRVMFEVHEAGGEHGLWTKAGDKLNAFSWNNEKPVYAFERIGSNTLKTLYGNIRKGQDGWAVDIQEANAFRMEMYKKYKHSSWDTQKTYKFTSSSGIEFELNTDQIMSLYAYSKRAQAHDHLLKGGFVFDGNTEVVVNKKGVKITYLNKTATAYNLSFEILENIISKLTPDQKAFVDDMQEYLSSTMGEKGNQVSMELYGVKLFNEKFYFPLRSAGQYMEKAKEADMKQKQGQVNIANSGFSKAVKIKASNPVVLTGFMEVWAGHVNEMSMYHSFVLPMEDFRRVYNYSSPHMEEQQSASVNGVIQNAYGSAATDYIDQLYRDLNGGALTDNRTGPINKLMGLFKKGAVFASASVTIQQPSAIARATALVDIKHFAGPKVDAKRHKALWEEVKQYAPVAVIKEMGFFDTNMGRSATDFLTAEEYSGIKEKAIALVKDESYRDELLSKAPALADELTWCVIWDAVKRETKAKNPKMDVKSEEFLRLAGDRFSEVIDKTQVYDSVLARSANMRSKDTGMKMATAFMAEPTTSINMVFDALRKGKKGNKKQAARIIGSVVSSVILNSFLVAWVYAARDDDEDETFREKYLSSFISGIKDGVNPMTYIPFLKDIVSIVQGYDVERSDMAVISDLWNAWKQLERDDVSAWRKVEGFVGSICQIFGLPVKNIMRDVRSVFQAYDTIFHGEENTIRGTTYAIVEGLTGQKVSNSEQLYAARKAGDEKHTTRVEGRYDDEKSADAAARKAITDRYMDDELTLAQATMELSQYAGMKPDEAYWLMDGWRHKKETGSDDYSKYDAFYDAVQTGKDLKAVIKTYTDNGVKEKTLSSQITDHFKEQYVGMSAAERAGLKGYLINAYEQCGVSREDAEAKLREWDFEAKHGGSYEEIVKNYKNGEVSEATMRNILAEKGYNKSEIEDKISDWNVYKTYGYEYSKLDDAYRAGELSREEFRQAMIDNGTFPAKADQAIITYDWMRDNPQYGLEYSDAAKYAHPIENYGYSLDDVDLDPDIYLDYKEKIKECKGVDDDNDGKADSGTLRTAKFEMIDSLPITNDQKDALAAIDYGMKSIKRYAPWH